jgi:hypothetical protein
MAMFAVRLGCWLGNPGPCGDHTFSLPAPRSSLAALINEALGRTNETSAFVYLSDGGHFENLGVYEMVMRGCTHIVVSDASTDGSYDFESLAVSIRKIRIDFGIPIEFDQFGDIGRFNDQTGHYCAIGKIRYSSLDKRLRDGTLLYVKASLSGSEPRDVLNYSSATGSFPQQSITDQFFSESQFESYRALGLHIMSKLDGATTTSGQLAYFIANVQKELAGDGAGNRQKLIQGALKRAAHGA